MSLPSIRYSNLKHLHFVDFNDHEMGTLDDIILEVGTLLPSALILGSSFFEEFMEEIGERDNIDEIAPLDCIDSIEDDYVILNCLLDDLETTDKKGNLKVDGIMFTDLTAKEVHLTDVERIGELYDYLLDADKSKFIFTLPGVSEKIFQEGYGQKFNLVLSPKLVKIENENILIKLSLDDIKNEIRKKFDKRERGRDLINWV